MHVDLEEVLAELVAVEAGFPSQGFPTYSTPLTVVAGAAGVIAKNLPAHAPPRSVSLPVRPLADTFHRMERRTLGRTGLQVSLLGFGGAELGFDDGVTDGRVAALLHPAIDAGLNVIDTASAYLGSEDLLGRALVGRRNQVHLFSKCGATDGFSRSDWSEAGIRHQVERSLRALKTDHLELLQLHSCSLDVLQRGEAILAVEKLRQEGKTRFIGYSGDGPPAVWAAECGRFDTLQTSINVADQRVLDEERGVRGEGPAAQRGARRAA